jgi:TolB-like protein/tetratricopeptide (TPR) repeat protein
LTNAVLEFGDHRLDISRRELRRGGDSITLEPKAFDLLAFLVQNRDRVVSKDDLLQAVWGGRIVSESALTTRINAVRRALGDDGASQRLVRTFSRKGIRFIGEVTEVSAPTAPSSSRDVSIRVSTAAEKASIAVLPFENMTGDLEQDYFVDGVVEEITTAISRLPWLLVIARNSSFMYKGKAVDVKQVAHELGVRYVLEGSVRKAGSRVRITGQLIDTAIGAHIWVDRFDGTLDDIFELQDRVASSVVVAIAPRLHLAEIERSRRKPTESLEAYDFYLRALAQVVKRTKDSLAEAVRLLNRALELDPAYAPAMQQISSCRVLQRSRHWIPSSGWQVDEGIAMARQAISAAGDHSIILTHAGFALAFLAGENETALSAIDRAIVLNPNYASAFTLRALVLVFLNRPDEAILAAQEALRLTPRSCVDVFSIQAQAFAHLAAGRYEAGLPFADQALRENGGLPALRFKLSLCGHLGRLDEAKEGLRRLHELHPEPTVASVMRDVSKGVAPEIVARMAEGLRKAGVPEI